VDEDGEGSGDDDADVDALWQAGLLHHSHSRVSDWLQVLATRHH
jgi:hypothetical protein